MAQERKAKDTQGTARENEKEFSLEASFARLDELLSMLESRDITLEAAFETYQRGMELIKKCNQEIDLMEKKMLVLNEEGELVDF